MKITIELSDAEVKGLKNYLKEVDDLKKVSKQYIKQHIVGIVHGNLHAPQDACSDYIHAEEQKLNH